MIKLRLMIPFLLVGIFAVFVLVTPRFVFAEQEPESKEPVVISDSPSSAGGADTQKSAPSFWGGFLSAIGLNNDMPTPPPQELKGAPEHFGQDYVIGPGDQLGITVWRDDMLTRAVLVLPDGKIQFPLIGELAVGGKTVGEVKKELVEKLASYVVDTDISVEVKQSSSLFIYIIGKVNVPGRQMLVADTTVLQALAMAGGVNTFASEDSIKIFRQQKDSTLVYTFRYSYVSIGKHLEDNILLKRGDVIVVP
jgi:polysaccharide export outer membrane protein